MPDLTYARLAKALEAFGYASRSKGTHVVYQHPDGTMMSVLPVTKPKDQVLPVHRSVVENTVRDDGIVSWADFQFFLENGKTPEELIRKGDHLIWTTPKGDRIPVVAAAGEKDGLVIIKQKGTISPCPVDQLRKEAVSRNGVAG